MKLRRKNNHGKAESLQDICADLLALTDAICNG